MTQVKRIRVGQVINKEKNQEDVKQTRTHKEFKIKRIKINIVKSNQL